MRTSFFYLFLLGFFSNYVQVAYAQSDTVFYTIEAALKTPQQVKILDLNGDSQPLITLENRHFKKFKNLHTLTVSSVPVLYLPASLAELPQLTGLELINCDLSQVPAVVWQCKNLQVLNLSCNRLDSISPQISQLKQLETLVLGSSACGGNPIKTLPENFDQLTQLTDLLLSYTDFEQVPATIGRLAKLKTLQMLHMRQLKALPETLTQLKNLEVLEIHSYAPIELFSIPHSGWYRMRKLRLLYMNLPGLKSLPRAMFQLPYLQHLSLMGNQDLAQIPPLIRKLQSLEVLDVSFTQIRQFPAVIQQLPHLKQIRLTGTPHFKKVQFTQLQAQLPGIEIVR